VFDAAIEQFLTYSFPEEELTIDVISDPAYRPACDRAVLFVFEAAQSDYFPTTSRREFLRTMLLVGLSLSTAAVGVGRVSAPRREPRAIEGSFEPVPQKQIDALDDDGVDRPVSRTLVNTWSIHAAVGVIQPSTAYRRARPICFCVTGLRMILGSHVGFLLGADTRPTPTAAK